MFHMCNTANLLQYTDSNRFSVLLIRNLLLQTKGTCSDDKMIERNERLKSIASADGARENETATWIIRREGTHTHIPIQFIPILVSMFCITNPFQLYQSNVIKWDSCEFMCYTWNDWLVESTLLNWMPEHTPIHTLTLRKKMSRCTYAYTIYE